MLTSATPLTFEHPIFLLPTLNLLNMSLYKTLEFTIAVFFLTLAAASFVVEKCILPFFELADKLWERALAIRVNLLVSTNERKCCSSTVNLHVGLGGLIFSVDFDGLRSSPPSQLPDGLHSRRRTFV